MSFGKVQFSIVEGHFEKHILKIIIFLNIPKKSLFSMTHKKKNLKNL